jgi:hypothetical protein
LCCTSAFAQQTDIQNHSLRNSENVEIVQPEITIYPVPIERYATISFNNFGDQNWSLQAVQLFNMLGNEEEVFTGSSFIADRNESPKIYKLRVDFSPHEPGIYFFRIHYGNLKTGKKHEFTAKVTYNG